jgi:hypothetical protein
MIQFNISLAIICFMMLVPTPHFSGKEEVTDKNIEDLDNMKG